jgi:chromosomal replication initiation ATPase DnaA
MLEFNLQQQKALLDITETAQAQAFEITGRVAQVIIRFDEEDIIRESKEELTSRIYLLVCEQYAVTMHQINGRSMKSPLPDARFMVIKLITEKLKMHPKQIGLQMGGRDRATIISALKTFSDHYETEPAFRELYNHFYNKLHKYILK